MAYHILHSTIEYAQIFYKEEKKYFLRKNDVAKANELAGISGKIEGKL